MAIFLLTKVQETLSPEQRKKLEAALAERYVEGWRDIGNGNYLVASSKPLTTQDFSSDLGIVDGSVGAYLVSVVDSYYGWANRSIWDWIKAMRERNERF